MKIEDLISSSNIKADDVKDIKLEDSPKIPCYLRRRVQPPNEVQSTGSVFYLDESEYDYASYSEDSYNDYEDDGDVIMKDA